MSIQQKVNHKINTNKILLLSAISVLYLTISYFLIGYKSEQLVLVGLVNGLFFISDYTRKVVIGFSVFIVFWIIYDYLKAVPNFNYREVTISGIYNLEKYIFGIKENDVVLTLNEYWIKHETPFLDLLCGFFYLNWMPVPLMFALYLFNTNKREFLYFSLSFFLVNMLGFVIYYIVPAAPPWYVQKYGFEFIPLTQSNVAGLIKFDQLVGVPVFQSIYSKGSNVFAAMPSLHSAYPLVVLVYSIRNSFKVMSVFFAVITAGIWFAAVYTSHHYLLDVLAGITCASVGILIFFYILLKIESIKKLIEKWEMLISKNAA
jgi:hypothetical protein